MLTQWNDSAVRQTRKGRSYRRMWCGGECVLTRVFQCADLIEEEFREREAEAMILSKSSGHVTFVEELPGNSQFLSRVGAVT